MWKIVIYQAKNKQWAWRLKAANNKVIADSAEQYVRRQGIMRAAQPLADALKAELWEAFSDGRKTRRIDNGHNIVPIAQAPKGEAPTGRAGGGLNKSLSDEDDGYPD